MRCVGALGIGRIFAVCGCLYGGAFACPAGGVGNRVGVRGNGRWYLILLLF